nr:TlpA family protein disulfide reductase [Oscillospiraceae bacterium]
MERVYRILKSLIAVLAAAVVLLGGWLLVERSSAQEIPGAEAGASETAVPAETQAASLAPEFTFYDLEGAAHTLSEFRGKPVLLNFWASWCGPCKSEMPDLEEAYRQYGEQIHFLVVDLTDGVQETVEKASGYIAGQGYTFPVYFDSGMEGAGAYGVTGIPVTYFIDEAGTFVAYYQGAMSADILQQGIDLLLEG